VPDDSVLNLDTAYEKELIESICSTYKKDPMFSKIFHTPLAYPSYQIGPDGRLWQDDRHFGPRLCVPVCSVRGRNVREVILEHLHSVLVHASTAKVVALAQTHFYWPTLTKDTELYCLSCPSCQASKVETAAPRGKLHPMPMPLRPYQEIALDCQGPFQQSRRGEEIIDFLFNFIDTFSGEVILVPTQEKGLTAQGAAEIFLEHVYPQWGVPQAIRSDRGAQWENDFWKTLFRGLGTTLAMSSSYHPATNRKIERMHRTLNAMLRQQISEEQADWAHHVGYTQYAINTSRSATTGYSPFELTRTTAPVSNPEWSTAPTNREAQEVIAAAKSRQLKSRDAIHKAQVAQTHQVNRHRRPDFAAAARARTPGSDPTPPDEKPIPEWVWLSSKHFSLAPNCSRKWVPPFLGPYEVIAYARNCSSFTLDLPPCITRRGINSRFHTSEIKPYVTNDKALFPGRLTNVVPVYPIDSLEMTVTVTGYEHHVDPHSGALKIYLFVTFEDGRRPRSTHKNMQRSTRNTRP
jgi:transposase InsO family protein